MYNLDEAKTIFTSAMLSCGFEPFELHPNSKLLRFQKGDTFITWGRGADGHYNLYYRDDSTNVWFKTKYDIRDMSIGDVWKTIEGKLELINTQLVENFLNKMSGVW